ncbi:MAG TPA: methyltransferase domain-containing protein [Ktedonobacteraceae bacterium]|nr:methyltransferase domain-containing protein [Ktedonobacteraceae bacterium]
MPSKRPSQAEQTPTWQRPATAGHPATIRAGRRFLESTYVLPKDVQEVHRLDFQHYLLRHALKGNYLAPIGVPQYILDVGAGTGRWGREMATLFPMAHVIGMDLEAAESSGPTPPNYTFAPGNVLERLPARDETFHFVHQRLLVAAIPALRWPQVIGELRRVTRPEGWLELVEAGMGTLRPGPLTTQLLQWGLQASLPHGLDARIIPHLDHLLHEAGFRVVYKHTLDIPIGSWGGRLGTMMQEDLLAAFGALEALYTHRAGTTEAFVDLIEQLPQEWERFQTSYRFFIFYGQK